MQTSHRHSQTRFVRLPALTACCSRPFTVEPPCKTAIPRPPTLLPPSGATAVCSAVAGLLPPLPVPPCSGSAGFLHEVTHSSRREGSPPGPAVQIRTQITGSRRYAAFCTTSMTPGVSASSSRSRHSPNSSDAVCHPTSAPPEGTVRSHHLFRTI